MQPVSRMILTTLAGMTLATALALLAGCGGAPTPPPPADPKTPPPADPGKSPADPAPSAQAPSAATQQPLAPSKDGPAAPPVAVAQPVAPSPLAGWEMDTAKQTIPASPAVGKLGGDVFAPAAQLQGDTLSFRVTDKDGNPERQVKIRFPADRAKALAGGLKLTVREGQQPGPDVPVVDSDAPPAKPGEARNFQYQNGYALTLELGPKDRGKQPGKVYLSLPGADKDFVAGTFTAEWVRLPSELPGPDDTPFVQGTITLTGGPADAVVNVGYVGQGPADELLFDSVKMKLGLVGGRSWSEQFKPRVTTLVAPEAAGKPGRYEHIRLTPGRYLVFAAVENGPVAWKWASVTPDAKLTHDFPLDAAKVGGLEVAVPAGATGRVQLVPADDAAAPVPSALFEFAAIGLGLEREPKDGTAKFEKLGPGKYAVRIGTHAGTVEVKPGETAKLDLAAKK